MSSRGAGALIGFTGMSAAVQTAVNMKDHMVHGQPHPRAEIRERAFKSTVALMSLPQSVLQTYIGIAYALHSPYLLRTDLIRHWNPLLFLTAALMVLIHQRTATRASTPTATTMIAF